ncbi:hypothetical protein ACVMHZ_009098 [Bradyrhizobium liaoningense]
MQLLTRQQPRCQDVGAQPLMQRRRQAARTIPGVSGHIELKRTHHGMIARRPLAVNRKSKIDFSGACWLSLRSSGTLGVITRTPSRTSYP